MEKEKEKKMARRQAFAKELQQQIDERTENIQKEREANLKYGEAMREEMKRKIERENQEKEEKNKIKELNRRYNLDQIQQMEEKRGRKL